MYTVDSTRAASAFASGSGGGGALASAAWPIRRRTSAATVASPAAAVETASWHMLPTMAAVELLSAPPDSGSK
jgi:hypothetical protein